MPVRFWTPEKKEEFIKIRTKHMEFIPQDRLAVRYAKLEADYIDMKKKYDEIHKFGTAAVRTCNTLVKKAPASVTTFAQKQVGYKANRLARVNALESTPPTSARADSEKGIDFELSAPSDPSAPSSAAGDSAAGDIDAELAAATMFFDAELAAELQLKENEVDGVAGEHAVLEVDEEEDTHVDNAGQGQGSDSD